MREHPFHSEWKERIARETTLDSLMRGGTEMSILDASEMRPANERFVTTRTGIQIGSSYVRPPRWQDAEAWSHSTRRDRIADRAVLVACAMAAAFLAGLLLWEHFA